MEEQFETKIKKIENHLKEVGYITQWEAITLYKATRLSAIIFLLKKRGWNIDSVRVDTTDSDGRAVHYVRYFLRNEK